MLKCPYCNFESKERKGLSYHMSMKHKKSLVDYEIETNNKSCKMCHNIIHPDKIYCSNKCKFADIEYNKSRADCSSIFNLEGLIYKCKKCDTFTAINNGGGILTQHINKCYTEDISVNLDNVYKYYYTIKESERYGEIVYTCKECNKNFYNNNLNDSLITGLATHLKVIHKLNLIDYVLKYNETDENITKGVKISRLLTLDKYGIECPLCKEKLLQINEKHLIKEHNISLEEFKIKYPFVNISDERVDKLKYDYITTLNEYLTTKEYINNTKPELNFANILYKSNINFKKEVTVRISNKFRWDFYIDKFKCFVEIDGHIHFQYFQKMLTDFYKNKDAKILNTKIYRIKTEEINKNIETIINKEEDIENLAYYVQDENGNILKESLELKNKIYDINNILMEKEKLLKIRNKNTYVHTMKDRSIEVLKYIRTFFSDFPIEKKDLVSEHLYNTNIYESVKNKYNDNTMLVDCIINMCGVDKQNLNKLNDLHDISVESIIKFIYRQSVIELLGV